MISDIIMLVGLPFFIFVILMFHEFGHFVMASIFKVKIDELSLGYGKKVWKRDVEHKPRLVLRRYPIVGRVVLNHESFESTSFIKQVLVILGGPIFNVILAFIIMFLAYFLIGQPSQPPAFTAIKVGQVAHQAGLMVDDRVLTLNGKPVTRYEQVSEITSRVPVEPITLEIQRGEESFEVALTPFEDEYIDIKGIERLHGILGVIGDHTPIKLESITYINDVEADDEDHARDLVIAAFDTNIILRLDTTDNREHDYQTTIRSSLNQHLFDEDHKRYEVFYLGAIADNFYHDLSFFESVGLAFKTTKTMFVNMAKLPTQVFPIDGTKLKPKTIVLDDDIVILNFMFRIAFFIGVMSIVIGFINLIPLPHFDGGQLLLLCAEKCSRSALTPKRRAIIIMVALFSMYGGLMVANFNKLPLYFDAKIENLSEWLEDS